MDFEFAYLAKTGIFLIDQLSICRSTGGERCVPEL
jgi:hypothetical protein